MFQQFAVTAWMLGQRLLAAKRKPVRLSPTKQPFLCFNDHDLLWIETLESVSHDKSHGWQRGPTDAIVSSVGPRCHPWATVKGPYLTAMVEGRVMRHETA